MGDPILYLKAHNPVPAFGADDPPFRVPMDRLDAIMATVPGRSGRRRRSRPAWAVAVAAVVVAVVASVVLFTRGGTSAAAALGRLAAATEHQKALVSSGRPVRTTITQLTSVTVGEGGGYVVLQPERIAMVIRPDGRTTRTTTTGEIRFPGPRDRRRWILTGRPPFASPGTATETFRAQPLSSPPPGYAATPGRMREHLRETARAQALPDSVGPFVIAQGLLSAGPVNPEIQANTYRALASLDGLSVVEGTPGIAGRRSVTLSVVSDHTGARVRYGMTFDARTGQLTSSSQVLLDPQPWIDAKPPFTFFRYTATPLSDR